MYYFIPAWYGSNKSWKHDEPVWFNVYDRIQYDDTINQFKMFRSLGEEAGILLLNYQPQFRYFLHKQGLLGSHYWSFFDDIQNIKRTYTKAIDFKTLNWPSNVQFIYTPFTIVAKEYGKDIAIIHFAENGNLLYIDSLKGNKIDQKYYFDDRGFLSSIIRYDDSEKIMSQDFLNEYGVWQVREVVTGESSHLEVNPNSDTFFEHQFYDNWESLLAERLEFFKKEMVKEEAIFVIAADDKHNKIVLSHFKTNTKILSFFEERFDYFADITQTESLLRSSEMLILDTDLQNKKLEDVVKQTSLDISDLKILNVSVFDTRLRLGHSQMLKELMIYFYIDTISDSEVLDAVNELLPLMSENPDIQLDIVTFKSTRALDSLKNEIESIISKKYDCMDFYAEADDVGLNQIDEGELELKSITFSFMTNEMQVIQELDKSRLILDLGKHPDPYTHIAGISAGIPQINKVESDYVVHQKNGWIIKNTKELSEAVDYYFDGLANWNASHVYAVQKMADYTSGRLLKQWKQLLRRT